MGEDQEVKVTVFGHPLAVKGLSMFVVLVLAAALGALIYLLVTVNTKDHLQQSEQQTQEHGNVVDALKNINRTNEQIQELVNEQNYMLLSDDKERKVMKERLHRPSSLSKKLSRENE